MIDAGCWLMSTGVSLLDAYTQSWFAYGFYRAQLASNCTSRMPERRSSAPIDRSGSR